MSQPACCSCLPSAASATRPRKTRVTSTWSWVRGRCSRESERSPRPSQETNGDRGMAPTAVSALVGTAPFLSHDPQGHCSGTLQASPPPVQGVAIQLSQQPFGLGSFVQGNWYLEILEPGDRPASFRAEGGSRLADEPVGDEGSERRILVDLPHPDDGRKLPDAHAVVLAHPDLCVLSHP